MIFEKKRNHLRKSRRMKIVRRMILFILYFLAALMDF
jgi:hypothetical protein